MQITIEPFFDVVSFNSGTYHPSVYDFPDQYKREEIPLQSLFTVGGMSILCRGTCSHLMIDDLVRSLFLSFMRVSVVYVYQKRIVSRSQWGSLLSFVSAFLSHLFCRHRSTVNKRKMLMGYTSDQTDEPSVQLVLIID